MTIRVLQGNDHFFAIFPTAANKQRPNLATLVYSFPPNRKCPSRGHTALRSGYLSLWARAFEPPRQLALGGTAWAPGRENCAKAKGLLYSRYLGEQRGVAGNRGTPVCVFGGAPGTGFQPHQAAGLPEQRRRAAVAVTGCTPARQLGTRITRRARANRHINRHQRSR